MHSRPKSRLSLLAGKACARESSAIYAIDWLDLKSTLLKSSQSNHVSLEPLFPFSSSQALPAKRDERLWGRYSRSS